MITGALLKSAFISGANNINNNRQAVDELNIFPVPDGDTGTNMSMTISNAAKALAVISDDEPVGSVADTAASALLRGARGNSGVILSLIFRGFSKGLKGLREADGAQVASALQNGVDAAYKAVMKPTEGTILTVIRCAAQQAQKAAAEDNDPVKVWAAACEGAQDALMRTPEQLPVLKAAGVVDAGGQGLVLILLGMQSVIEDNTVIPGENQVTAAASQPKSVVASASDDIKFGYCSEFIINKNPGCTLNPLRLRAYLESIGDCVVVVEDDSIIKVHVHSNEPGNVIQAALKYGPLVNIKIDNMRYQHQNAALGTGSSEPVKVKPVKPIGFVAVAAGSGLEQLFRDLGADAVVSGGQTMNPSTEDILKAIETVPAESVIVLPNNKNIIMAAEQTIPLSEKKVSVLPTRTIPQGITAMLNFDDTSSSDENLNVMAKAAEKVSTGLVTFAARDSEVNGQHVQQGQILGMENGKITVIEKDFVTAAFKITKRMFKRSSSLITIIKGDGVSDEDTDKLVQQLSDKFSDAEVSVIDGGQPVYYFIISVE